MNVVRDRRDSRWDAHREQKRAELVAAAITTIRHRGAAAGMDDVAATAGTSKTVVYRHFGDRTGLWAAVCASVAHVLTTEIRRATTQVLRGAGPEGAREAVAAGVDAYLRLIESDPELYRFVVNRPLPSGPPGRPEPDPVKDLVTVIGDEFAAAIGRRLPADRQAMARPWGHAVVGLVRGAADDWLTRPGGTTRGELTEALTELAWCGLSPLAAAPTTSSTEERA